MPLKEFKVTLWPRPKTYTVMAETPIQAGRIADDNYLSQLPVLEDVAYRHDVEESLPESEAGHELSNLP